MNRESSVGIAIGYGLDVRMIGVRFPARDENFSRHHVQTGSGVHSAFYPTDIWDFFSESKAAVA
jgi:hypothetical protein